MQLLLFGIFVLTFYFVGAYVLSGLVLFLLWMILKTLIPQSLKRGLVMDFKHFVIWQPAFLAAFLGICYFIYANFLTSSPTQPKAEKVALFVTPFFLILYQIGFKFYQRIQIKKNVHDGRSF